MTDWHTIELGKNSTKNNVSAQVEIGPESPWFSGHFPDEPILPGFAVLAMVFEAIQLSSNKKYVLAGLKKIRFKQVIKPGDHLEIKAEKQNNIHSYSFTVHANGIHACKGRLLVNHFNKT
jgi:3-hydroxyacyl-[acyl-carrier-protein] dehydratase